MAKRNSYIKEIFEDEEGYASSKRIIGAIIIFIALGCIIWLTVTEGGTNVVEDLLSTALFIGGTLLGISSIASIWKYPNIKNNTKEIEETPSEENPCDTCVYNKKE